MLPEKLQDSLLAAAKKNGNRSRRQFTASLRKQREARAAKAANAIAMKLQSTEKDLINISYLYQTYFSPCCWKTVSQALDLFEQLISKKVKNRMREGANINEISWARVGRSPSPMV
jgi:hypothetical protein